MTRLTAPLAAAMILSIAAIPGEVAAQEGYGAVKDGIRARQVQVMDTQGPWNRPLVAYTVLVPSHWQTQGGIEWGINDGCNGVGWQVNWVAASADAEYGFAMLPNQNWAYSPSGTPTGSQCPAAPVNSAGEYLQWRASMLGQDVQVIGYRERPDLLNEVGLRPGREPNPVPGATVLYFDAGELHFTYLQEGQRYEAVMSAAVVISVGQVAEMSLVNGTTLGVFLSAAPQGKLDLEVSDLMQKSIAIGPEWASGLAQRAAERHRQAMAASSAAHAATMQGLYEANATIAQGYAARTDMRDAGHRETMEAVRGVETYTDPVLGQPVQLDNSYQRTWRLDDGTYLLSNDANLEPFRDLGIGGQALQVAQ